MQKPRTPLAATAPAFATLHLDEPYRSAPELLAITQELVKAAHTMDGGHYTIPVKQLERLRAVLDRMAQ